jgi:hypothetical protein
VAGSPPAAMHFTTMSRSVSIPSSRLSSPQVGVADCLLTDLVLARARFQGSYARGSASSTQCGPLRAA